MALQNSDMRLEVQCNYTDKRRIICLAPPSPIDSEFDEVNFEMDEEEEDDFPYQHSTPENYVSMYSDWWDYREVANPYRPSPLRAILAIQLSLLVMDPSVTTCGVCGNPCKRVRRTQQSYCSDECKRVKQIEWSTENRKKRTLFKGSLPEATPEAG
ncbi:MAG: hypothetical protein H7308_12935 [Chthonomonadaceae bacterium]|nr:hypothetical protein [Chthonomonadaceae bacterium]